MGDAMLLTNQYRTREFLQVLLPTGLGLVMIVFALSSLYIFIMLHGCILVILVVKRYVSTSSSAAGITALAGIVLLALSVHTWLIHSGVISPENLHIIHYAAPGFFILISFSLLTTFLSSLKETAELARTLEQRVQNTGRELVASYEHVKALEQRQAITEERERIMRDMHDVFGGQLVGAISMTDSSQSTMGDLSKNLRSALMDLRIINIIPKHLIIFDLE